MNISVTTEYEKNRISNDAVLFWLFKIDNQKSSVQGAVKKVPKLKTHEAIVVSCVFG